MADVDQLRRLQVENKALQSKIETIERDKERAILDRHRLENEKALIRTQCDELIAVERRKVDSLRKDETSQQAHEADLRRRQQEEVERLTRQLNVATTDSNKRIGDLESQNAKLHGQVATLQKDLKERERQASTLNKDNQFSKENFERVIKELVEKNKRLEEEGKRRTEKANQQLDLVVQEHDSTVQELMESRRAQQALNEEKVVLESQLQTSKAVNQDLLEDIERARKRARDSEGHFDEVSKDLEAARALETDLRADVDELVSKLNRADSHISRLTEDAAAANVGMMKLRHQIETLESELEHAKQNNDAVLHRVSPLIMSSAESMEQLLQSNEDLLAAISDLISVGLGQTSPVQPRNSRNKIWNDHDSEGEQLLAGSLRLRDAITLAIEDIAYAIRGVSDEVTKKRDLLRKDALLEDAVKAERAHVIEVAEKLNHTEQQLKDANTQRVAAEQSLMESSQWMSEAVSLGEERTKRIEGLLAENQRLEANAEAARRDTELARTVASKAEAAAEDLRVEMAKCQRELRSIAHAQQLDNQDTNKARAMAQALRLEIEEKDRQVQSLKSEVSRHRDAENSLDADLGYAKAQNTDLAARLKDKDILIGKLEAEKNSLVDRLHEAERRLESALRRPAFAGGGAAIGGGKAADTSFGSPILSSRTPPPPTTTGSTVHSTAFGATAGGSFGASSSRRVSPPRQRFSDAIGGATTPSSALRSEHNASMTATGATPALRSPPRSSGGGASNAVASMSFDHQLEAERSSNDRLRAWESRIQSLLAQQPKGPQ